MYLVSYILWKKSTHIFIKF